MNIRPHKPNKSCGHPPCHVITLHSATHSLTHSLTHSFIPSSFFHFFDQLSRTSLGMSTWVTMLPCLRSGNSLIYSDRDTATARCRLSKQVFKQYRANIGWIFHFEVILPPLSKDPEEENKVFEVLCTAWPKWNDPNESDEELRVFLDDSVVKGPHPPWCEGKCRVLRAHPPNPCGTVRCLVPPSSSNGEGGDLVTSVFGGFPVAADFRLTASPCAAFKSAAKSFTVNGLAAGQYGVIDVMTLLMAASEESKENSSSSSGGGGGGGGGEGSAESPRASSTGVVHTIIRSCIFPSLLLPAKQLYTSGVLLSGPPGVGASLRHYHLCACSQPCSYYMSCDF